MGFLETLFYRVIAIPMGIVGLLIGYEYVVFLKSMMYERFGEIKIDGLYSFLMSLSSTVIVVFCIVIGSVFVEAWVWTCVYINLEGFRQASGKAHLVFSCLMALLLTVIFN